MIVLYAWAKLYRYALLTDTSAKYNIYLDI